LFSYLRRYRGLLISGLILNILGMVGEFVAPLFIGKVIDAISAKDEAEVKWLVVLWMIFNCAGAVFAGINRFVFSILTERIGRDIRQDLFEEIIKKEVAFFDSRKTGDLISRLQSDTVRIENALANQVALMIKGLLFDLIVLIMFFTISW